MPTKFEQFLAETKPQQGETVFGYICMNEEGNTMTGIKLLAFLHAVLFMVEKYGVDFQFYIEVNPINNQPNTYFEKWKTDNAEFLKRAEKAKHGSVKTLDLLEKTDEWKENKQRYIDFCSDLGRASKYEELLSSDVIEYAKSHPNAQNVAEHIQDVTVTLLTCHMKGGDEFANMKNYAFYDHGLSKVQGQVLQLAPKLGYQEKGLLHYSKFGTFMEQFQEDCPEDFAGLRAAAAQQKANAAMLAAEKAKASSNIHVLEEKRAAEIVSSGLRFDLTEKAVEAPPESPVMQPVRPRKSSTTPEKIKRLSPRHPEGKKGSAPASPLQLPVSAPRSVTSSSRSPRKNPEQKMPPLDLAKNPQCSTDAAVQRLLNEGKERQAARLLLAIEEERRLLVEQRRADERKKYLLEQAFSRLSDSAQHGQGLGYVPPRARSSCSVPRPKPLFDDDAKRFLPPYVPTRRNCGLFDGKESCSQEPGSIDTPTVYGRRRSGSE